LARCQALAAASASELGRSAAKTKIVMTLQRLLRFRLRTIFLVVTVVACFLAWRLRDRERPAVDAIEKAGGRVHFNFQGASPSWSAFSVAMLPECIYFSQVRVGRHGPMKPPRPNVIGVLIGNTDNCVVIAEVKLEHMLPAMIDHLKSLKHLRFIVLDMPLSIILRDSVEAQRLSELKKEFGGRLCPAYNRGAFARD
jgi:hypothetical protein